ncbi:MAG: DNA-binding protein [Candidatus Marinimicrobia bacterium]|nr:DNA-binding protein [Candidatus Neomarinimicrobiota bacterium]
MKFKKFGQKYVIRIEKGEEIIATLEKFCQKENIKAGSIIGIGAAGELEIGHFEAATKEYHSKKFEGDLEIAPLAGNISTKDGEVYLHIHANISDAELKSYSGHLNSAIVSATFECIIKKFEGQIGRKFSPEIGLNLFDLE